MTRISPDQLIVAFLKIKKKPIRGEFINKKGDGCCAMSATVVDVLKPKGFKISRYNVGTLAKDHLGLSEFYFSGFVTGWDGRPHSEVPDDRDAIRGYSDGKTGWEMCIEEGLVTE